MSSTVERDAEIIRLPEERWRESYDLFMAALHMHPVTDERWTQVRPLYHPEHTLGVLDDKGSVIATSMTSPNRIALPGGNVVVAPCGTAAGVRADHVRRGLLDRMAVTWLVEMAERGEVLALARPSSAALYQRWGFGPATRTQGIRVDRSRCALHPDLAHRRERVRRLAPDVDLMAVLPPAQLRAAPARAGTIARSAAWWGCWNPYAGVSRPVHAAVTDGPDGPDGYVTWYVEYEGPDVAAMRRVVHVVELFASTPAKVVDLWCYLLSLDLVEEIRALNRPLDEHVQLLLTDERACRVGEVRDELWMGFADVAEALRLRGWAPTAGDSVVLEVLDRRLPGNTGRYRIGSDGVERTGREPDLTCPAYCLSGMYLGDRLPSHLAAVGMLEVHDPAALPRADRLFATSRSPWGGSMF